MVRVCTWARTEEWWGYVTEQGLKNEECMYLSKYWKMMYICTWAGTEEWWVYVPEQELKNDECMYLSKDWRMTSACVSVLYSVYLSKYSSVNQEMQTDSMRASLGLSTALPCKSCAQMSAIMHCTVCTAWWFYTRVWAVQIQPVLNLNSIVSYQISKEWLACESQSGWDLAEWL
jgi:hypothetical protein